MTATDRLLIPVAPTLLDVREIGRATQIVEDLTVTRPIAVDVLLTRVRAGTTSARDARTGLTGQGLPLLDAQVSLREAYAGAWGTTPADLLEYDQVLTELQQREGGAP